MVEEFSIYVKNRPSQFGDFLNLISEKGIDIRAFCILESKEYSIIRVIFDNVKLAKETLQKNDIIFTINEVFAVLVTDKPGSFISVVQVFSKEKINIEYAYQGQSKHPKYATMVIAIKNIESSKRLIVNNPSIRLLSTEEI